MHLAQRVTAKSRRLTPRIPETIGLTDVAREDEKKLIRKWLKRTFYVILLLIVFVSIPFIVDALARWATGTDWTEAFAETWFSDQESAQVFLLGFGVIVGLFAIMMYFILGIFSGDEGGW
jgi:hypothetical protein